MPDAPLFHRATQATRSMAVSVRDGYLRELALAISLVSLGSSQTFFLPQRRTLEASLFWSRSILRRTTDTAQHHGSFPRPDGAFAAPKGPGQPAAGLQAAGRAAATARRGRGSGQRPQGPKTARPNPAQRSFPSGSPQPGPRPPFRPLPSARPNRHFPLRPDGGRSRLTGSGSSP